MRIEEIVWLDVIVDKLAVKHGVETEEVEEVLNNNPRFRFVESGQRVGEDVYLASGQTEGGRYLSVLFIHKSTGDALKGAPGICQAGSASDMNENKLPEFESIAALTDFFDHHDMGEYFDAMPEVHFDVEIQRRTFLVPVDRQLMKKLAEVAKSQHTSTGELVNAWLEEKVAHAA